MLQQQSKKQVWASAPGGRGGYGWGGANPFYPHQLYEITGPGCHQVNHSGLLPNLTAATGREEEETGAGDAICGPGFKLFVEMMNTECVTFELVVSLILVGVTCGMGLVGNVLSIMTLQRDTVHSVTTFLLTMLAAADIAFILPAIVVILVPSYCEYFQHCADPLRNVQPYLEQYGWAVASFSHSCTVYITVLVAIHRYFYVCRPHDCHRLSGLTRARKHALLVPVGALFFNLPRVFEYKVVKVKIELDTNTTFVEMLKVFTTIGGSKVYQILYKNILFLVIMYIIPLTTLITLSIKLAQALHRRRLNKYRGRSSQSITHRRDDNITFVLIIIIVVFVVCQTPTLLQRLILAVAGDQGHQCGHIYFYFEQLADYFAVLNSCINFVIYVLFARRFRHTLVNDIMCKHLRMTREDSTKNSDKDLKEVNASDQVCKKAPLISIKISKNKSTSHQASSSPDPKSCPGGLKLNNGALCPSSLLSPDSNHGTGTSQHTSVVLTSTSEIEISTFEPEVNPSANSCTGQGACQGHSGGESQSAGERKREEGGSPNRAPPHSGLALDTRDEVALQGNSPNLLLDQGEILESMSDPELDSPSESLLQADSSAFHASV